MIDNSSLTSVGLFYLVELNKAVYLIKFWKPTSQPRTVMVRGFFVYIKTFTILHPIHVQLVFKRPVFLYGFFVVYLLRQFSCFFVSPFLLRFGVFCYLA